MKYEKEIDEMLKCIDNDEQLINSSLSLMGMTKEELSEQIEIGVQNGYSVEYQCGLVRNVMGVLKKRR